MTEKDMLDIIIKLIFSSLPGFFSYFYLQEVDILQLNRNRDSENKLVLLSFSFVNIGLGLLMFQIKWINEFPLFVRIIIVVLILILVTMIVYPWIICFGKYVINLIRSDSELGAQTYKSDWKALMTTGNSKRISIFDFSGNHVISGFTDKIPNDIQFDYFLLVMQSEYIDTDSKLTEAEVTEQYEKAVKDDNGKYFIFVDMEKKYKIHVYDDKKKGKDN
ncbi:hypothetical protein I6N95_25670 [Vagococcus sp. BWB3-3]|uniref:Uncharacterized protein n=1 Tax=Vagococcus allomyrinae TaxID=2794353 RepID=A0A940PGW5_9ENTE|nr:hypothetical protein [Vagococcus allomyrinae]MBP1044402.1 hypothetical protein [Vagococcus allomyrinae]